MLGGNGNSVYLYIYIYFNEFKVLFYYFYIYLLFVFILMHSFVNCGFFLQLVKSRIGNDLYAERGMNTFNEPRKLKNVQTSKITHTVRFLYMLYFVAKDFSIK